MRVLIAPDKFAGSLTAGEAAAAIAEGWHEARPQDEVTALPVADGGPGFVDALAAAVPATRVTVDVRGPDGETVPAVMLRHDEGAARTFFIESAEACGLHLTDKRHATTTSTFGVGELLAAAVSEGATQLVVGLGGSATTDGGAGLLGGLGANGRTASGAGCLDGGGTALMQLAAVDLGPALDRVAGVAITLASDVDVPLLGPTGAALGFGRQKGASPQEAELLESALAHWHDVCTAGGVPADMAGRPAAGAAGGLGYGLLVLGGRVRSGAETVLDAIGFDRQLAQADVLVTGEGKFDWQSMRGKLIGTLAERAGARGVPVIVLAGQSEMEPEAWQQHGLTEVRSVVAEAGSVAAAMAQAAQFLRAAARSAAAGGAVGRRLDG